MRKDLIVKIKFLKIEQILQIIFAIYFAYYFVSFLSIADIILQTTNIKRFNYVYGIDLSYAQLKLLLQMICIAGFFCSALFMFGIFSRIFGIIIWILLVLSLNINLHLSQLHYAYLSIVIISAAIMSEQPWTNWKINFNYFTFTDDHWKKYVHYLFSISLFTSGASKIFLEIWKNGSALEILCFKGELVKVIPGYCSFPSIFFMFQAYAALFIEVGSIFVFIESFRKYIWKLQMVLFAGTLLTVYVSNVTSAMLISFIFLYEKKWLKKSKVNSD